MTSKARPEVALRVLILDVWVWRAVIPTTIPCCRSVSTSITLFTGSTCRRENEKHSHQHEMEMGFPAASGAPFPARRCL